MRLRPALGNLALAATSILSLLAVLEIAARIDHHTRGGGKERQEALEYIDADEYLGWRKVPGARVTYERREYTVEVVVNSLGMRDPERSEEPRGAWRVLALGDSFIEGYSVALEDTLTQQLERRLDRPHCRVEVLNGGTAAWATDQEYLYYAREAHRFGARVVLLFLYYNDILANTQAAYFGAPKPLLEMRDGALVLTNHPVAHPRRERPERTLPERDPIEGSAAWQWMKERLEVGAPRLHNRLAAWGLWAPLGGNTILEQERVYKRRRRPTIDAAWQRTDEILRALAHEVEARAARLAIVYVPSRREVSDRDWELTRLRYEFDDRWDRWLVAERVHDLGRSVGVPVLDLTRPLREADGALGGAPYFTFDGHWNRRGHAVAAESVAAFLERQGWLPPCSVPED